MSQANGDKECGTTLRVVNSRRGASSHNDSLKANSSRQGLRRAGLCSRIRKNSDALGHTVRSHGLSASANSGGNTQQLGEFSLGVGQQGVFQGVRFFEQLVTGGFVAADANQFDAEFLELRQSLVPR